MLINRHPQRGKKLKSRAKTKKKFSNYLHISIEQKTNVVKIFMGRVSFDKRVRAYLIIYRCDGYFLWNRYIKR